MVAEIRFDQTGDFSLFLVEHHVVERFDHRATPEKAQIAALLRRTGIPRTLPGQVGKTRRVFPDFRQHLFGLVPGFLPVVTERDQDVAGAPLFGQHVAVPVALVPRLDLGLAHRRPWQQGVERQNDIFGFDLLRHLEAALVLVVELLHALWRDLHLFRELAGSDPELAELAFLGLDAPHRLGLRRGHDGRRADRPQQPLQRHILAQSRLELLRERALRSQHGFVKRFRE